LQRPRPHRSTLFPYTTLFRSRILLDGFPFGPAQVRHQNRLCLVFAQIIDRGETFPDSSVVSDMDLSAAQLGRDIEINPHEHAFRSEEHTSELQSRFDLVCRLL